MSKIATIIRMKSRRKQSIPIRYARFGGNMLGGNILGDFIAFALG
jgi:hypothetical protein